MGVKEDSNLHIFLQVAVTFILVMVAWAFFRANTISDALYIIRQLPQGIKDFFHALKTRNIWLGQIASFMPGGALLLSFCLIVFLEAVHYAQSKTNLTG